MFSILLLAPDQWKLRQQLEGFLQFGGSLVCWEVTVTFCVIAPPTGFIRKRSQCDWRGLITALTAYMTNSISKFLLPIGSFSVILKNVQRANLFTTIVTIICLDTTFNGLILHWTMNHPLLQHRYVTTATLGWENKKLGLWYKQVALCHTHLAAGPTAGVHTPQE